MNPFRYSGPVSASEVIDREDILKRLSDTAESANNSRLLAPREYGKTSLLNKLRDGFGKEGWSTVYVDFFGVRSLQDVAQRVEDAYQAQLRGDLAAWFEGIRRRFSRVVLGGGEVPISVEVDVSPAERGLIERLDTPLRILESHGVRTLVVFDEFQDVLEAREDADEVIRSSIQHHGEAASYVFAGSELGLMTEMFTDRRRAFYRQADRVDLLPLDPGDLGEYIRSRFKSGKKRIGADALGALLDRAEGHPRTAMLLAHELWDRAEPEVETDLATYDQAEVTAMEKASSDLRAIWRGTTASERDVLTRLARGSGPYSKGADGQKQSGGAVAGAVNRLLDAGEITDLGGTYRIVDPLLAELIRRNWSV